MLVLPPALDPIEDSPLCLNTAIEGASPVPEVWPSGYYLGDESGGKYSWLSGEMWSRSALH